MTRLKMSDDLAITIAMLHGCTFYKWTSNVWYAREDENPSIQHPVEIEHSKTTGQFFFTSKQDLARVYCRFYNLDKE